MKTFIFSAMLAATLAACTSVGPPGHNYQTGLVDYEDQHIIRLRGETDWVYVKYNPGEPVPTDEQANLWNQQAFYVGVIDDHERAGLYALAGLQVADVATTYIGLKRGCVEGNPLFRSPRARIVGLLFKGGYVWLAYKAAKSTPLNKSAQMPIAAAATITAMPVIHNLLINCRG